MELNLVCFCIEMVKADVKREDGVSLLCTQPFNNTMQRQCKKYAQRGEKHEKTNVSRIDSGTGCGTVQRLRRNGIHRRAFVCRTCNL